MQTHKLIPSAAAADTQWLQFEDGLPEAWVDVLPRTCLKQRRGQLITPEVLDKAPEAFHCCRGCHNTIDQWLSVTENDF